MAGTQIKIAPDTGDPAVGKTQLAYQWIKERITNGNYSSGYRLVLSQIAKDIDVSVVPVREAIRLLEAEGLVTMERNVGAQVAMIEPTEYLYTMQTLSIVEGAATALSAPHISSGTIKRARALNAEMIECVQHFDPNRFTELNLQFHLLLFERCPNPHLLDLVYRGWNRLKVLRDSIFSFVPGRAQQSVGEHEHLLRLVAAGAKPVKIELATRAHRMATLNAFLAYQEQQDKNTNRATHGPRVRKAISR